MAQPQQIIGRDGLVCENWGEWSGGSFGGIVCPDCQGAPPKFEGKHAGDCPCCQANYEGCEGDFTSLGCTHSGWDVDHDPSDCRLGSFLYGAGTGGVSVSVSAHGSVKSTGLVYSGKRPMRLSGSFQMQWSCGTRGDIVKGHCISGRDPETGTILYEDGICSGGSSADVSLISMGVNRRSSTYDSMNGCPCNCGGPLLGHCNAGPEALAYWWPGSEPSSGWGEYWDMSFAQAPIKGMPEHSLGRDPTEIGRYGHSTGHEGNCISIYEDTPGECGLCNNANHCSYADTVGVTSRTYLAYIDCTCCSEAWGQPIFYEECHEDCDQCEPGSQPCDFPMGYHPTTGELHCKHCPQAVNQVEGCTVWDCLRWQTCGEGYANSNDYPLDPVVVPYGACYIALRVRARVFPGSGCWDPNPECETCACTPGCEGNVTPKPGCVSASASISAVPA